MPFLLRFIVGLVIFIYFEIAYLWAAHGHTISEVYYGNTSIDQKIPLISVFIIPYILGYLFVFVPLFLFKEKSDYYWGISIFVISISVTFIVFKFFPVYMDKSYATGVDIFSKLNLFQQKNDTSFNNCPSLHVALNVYAWALLFLRYGKKMIYISWAPVLIVASTVFVKQHLLMDVVAGLMLGVLMVYLFKLLSKNTLIAPFVFYFWLCFVMVVILYNWKQVGEVFTIASNLIMKSGFIGVLTVVLLVVVSFISQKVVTSKSIN